MSKDLEVRHCRALVAVHDQGGVGAAAQALGVAQSTVSETLLSLERLLGVAVLLRRPGRETTLTADAEALLPHARALIAASEAALGALARRGPATIRLGATESISSFLLPAPLRAFRQAWPQVDVRITIGLCEDLRRKVERGELDLALTIEGERDGGEVLREARLVFVVAPGHALAGRRVKRHELDGLRFLLADAEGAFYALLKGWAGGDGLKLESAGSVDGVKRGVLDGDGAIGVLPDYAVMAELLARSLVALDVGEALPGLALRLETRDAPDGETALGALVAQLRGALRAVS